ncbi:hypothetical protein AB0425_30960 [Actinosynnema sp. NPDC051121]
MIAGDLQPGPTSIAGALAALVPMGFKNLLTVVEVGQGDLDSRPEPTDTRDVNDRHGDPENPRAGLEAGPLIGDDTTA